MDTSNQVHIMCIQIQISGVTAFKYTKLYKREQRDSARLNRIINKTNFKSKQPIATHNYKCDSKSIGQ
jgi:hypothetical protein